MFFSVFMTVKQTKKKIKIHLLLSSPLLGLLRDTEKVFKWEVTWLRIPTGRRQTNWLFHKRCQRFVLRTTKNKSS